MDRHNNYIKPIVDLYAKIEPSLSEDNLDDTPSDSKCRSFQNRGSQICLQLTINTEIITNIHGIELILLDPS
jgi:hypothetical protein